MAKTPKNVTIKKISRSDWDGDGDIDSIYTETKTYDKKETSFSMDIPMITRQMVRSTSITRPGMNTIEKATS